MSGALLIPSLSRCAAAAIAAALCACQSIPAEPTIWTTADLARAIETNLASVAREVGGAWAPSGSGCRSGLFDMSLGDNRPAFMPDVAALVALVPGAELTYSGRGTDPAEQLYTLGAPGTQATLIRDLRSDGIIWRRPNGDQMRLYPDEIAFQSGRLSLLIDDDVIRIQIDTASLLEFERC